MEKRMPLFFELNFLKMYHGSQGANHNHCKLNQVKTVVLVCFEQDSGGNVKEYTDHNGH